MKFVRGTLILVMGLLYYLILAVPLSVVDCLFVLGYDPKSLIVIWSWPVLMSLDPEQFFQGMAKAAEEKAKKDDSH